MRLDDYVSGRQSQKRKTRLEYASAEWKWKFHLNSCNALIWILWMAPWRARVYTDSTHTTHFQWLAEPIVFFLFSIILFLSAASPALKSKWKSEWHPFRDYGNAFCTWKSESESKHKRKRQFGTRERKKIIQLFSVLHSKYVIFGA